MTTKHRSPADQDTLEALRIVLYGLDRQETPDAIAQDLIRSGLETKLRSDVFRSPHDRRRAQLCRVRFAISDNTMSIDFFSRTASRR